MSNKEKLVDELKALGLDDLAQKAMGGEFSDFASPHAAPVTALVRALHKAGPKAECLRRRVMNGDFDHDR